MGSWRIVLVLAIVVAAPLAQADGPFPLPETCAPTVDIEPLPVVSVCTPRSCSPVAQCEVATTPTTTECAANVSIDGETCQAGVVVGVARPEGPTSAAVEVEQSDGNVDAQNLPNTWISPSAGARASLLGADLGRTTVGVYRSDIVGDGQSWSELGVYARHDGATTREGVLVAVWLLGGVPDGCVVRTYSAEDVRCPGTGPARGLIPTLP